MFTIFKLVKYLADFFTALLPFSSALVLIQEHVWKVKAGNSVCGGIMEEDKWKEDFKKISKSFYRSCNNPVIWLYLVTNRALFEPMNTTTESGPLVCSTSMGTTSQKQVMQLPQNNPEFTSVNMPKADLKSLPKQ